MSWFYSFALVAILLFFAFPKRVEANEAVKKEIEQLVSSHKVQIFSKSYCPFCRRAKGIFDAEGISYEALELDQIANGAEFQSTLAAMTGQRTVPSVWINGKFVGGSDKVAELQSRGKLSSLVNTEL